MKDNYLEISFREFVSENPEIKIIASIPHLVALVEENSWGEESLSSIYPIDFRDISVAFFSQTKDLTALSPEFVENELGVSPKETRGGNLLIDFSEISNALSTFYDENKLTFDLRQK